MKHKLLLIYLLLPIQVFADWRCEVDERFGTNPPSKIELRLGFNSTNIKTTEASLKSETFEYRLGPISAYENTYDYIEQASSNMVNERITSTKIFRFNSQSGDLVYIDHNNSQQMIVGKCLHSDL